MPGVVRTYLLPQLLDPDDLRAGVAVVIDQLRASTTICAALAAGAAALVPCLTPDDAARVKAGAPPGTVLTGGEREGVLISGFDLDNSPGSYTPERVRGRTIAFTTTNGTRAALLCRDSGVLVAGCLGNLSALVDDLASGGVPPRDRGGSVCGDSPIHLICAGTRDRVSLDDVAAAGAIADRLAQRGHPIHLDDARPDDDSTHIAIALWHTTRDRPEAVLDLLRSSRGGRNLIRENLAADIDRCAVIDAHRVVPIFDDHAGAFVARASRP